MKKKKHRNKEGVLSYYCVEKLGNRIESTKGGGEVMVGKRYESAFRGISISKNSSSPRVCVYLLACSNQKNLLEEIES